MSDRNSTKFFSKKQEKSVAKALNGRITVASGALWFQKADVSTSDLLIECKTTEKDYFNFTSKLWEKILKEADRDGLKIPVFVIDFNNRKESRVYLFNPSDFDILQNTFIKMKIFDSSNNKTQVRIRKEIERYEALSFQLKKSEFKNLDYAPVHKFVMTDEFTFLNYVYKNQL